MAERKEKKKPKQTKKPPTPKKTKNKQQNIIGIGGHEIQIYSSKPIFSPSYSINSGYNNNCIGCLMSTFDFHVGTNCYHASCSIGTQIVFSLLPNNQKIRLCLLIKQADVASGSKRGLVGKEWNKLNVKLLLTHSDLIRKTLHMQLTGLQREEHI